MNRPTAVIMAEKGCWLLDRDAHGASFGTRVFHGHRRLANGVYLGRTVRFPSVLDQMAKPYEKHEVVEEFFVFSGATGRRSPPIAVPQGAEPCLVDFDGQEEWHFRFKDEEKAEAYALSLHP